MTEKITEPQATQFRVPFKPHPTQRTVFLDEHRFKVCACGRRWGKTKLGAALTVLEIFKAPPDSVGFVVAPTYTSTSLGKCWREFLRYCPKEKIKKIHSTPGDRYIELDKHRIIYFKSADRPEMLAGEGLSFVWCDEPATYTSDVWERVLPPALMDKHGKAWFTGTPSGRNWYFRLFMEGQDTQNTEVKSWNFSSYENSIEQGGYIPKAEIDTIANRLPWQARQQEIMGEFLQDIGQVFRGVDLIINGTLEPPKPNMTYVGGVDLAKLVDYTVVIIMDENGHIVFFDRFGEIDWPFQRKRIIEIATQYNNARLLIDSTGVGDPNYDDLRRESVHVEGYKLTHASKAELIENASMMIERQKVSIPGKPAVRNEHGQIIQKAVSAIPDLTGELEIFGWTKSKGGNIIYNAPEGYHDDCVIGFSLAAWMSRTTGPLEVGSMSVPW